VRRSPSKFDGEVVEVDFVAALECSFANLMLLSVVLSA
jgi:hypothetical protein